MQPRRLATGVGCRSWCTQYGPPSADLYGPGAACHWCIVFNRVFHAPLRQCSRPLCQSLVYRPGEPHRRAMYFHARARSSLPAPDVARSRAQPYSLTAHPRSACTNRICVAAPRLTLHLLDRRKAQPPVADTARRPRASRRDYRILARIVGAWPAGSAPGGCCRLCRGLGAGC
jgi:hypothetical protein